MKWYNNLTYREQVGFKACMLMIAGLIATIVFCIFYFKFVGELDNRLTNSIPSHYIWCEECQMWHEPYERRFIR